MKPVLIDSDVLIEVSRGRNQEIISRWEDLISADVAVLCSPVTVAEVWHGARPKEFAMIEALFSGLFCVPVTMEVGRKAGEYLRKYAGSHGLELGDALIASAADERGAFLWTRNRKHYPMAELVFF